MTCSSLRHDGYVALPEHRGTGGFDHAAVCTASGHVYAAHTANDAADAFDPASGRHLFPIPRLPGIAGLVISDDGRVVTTLDRSENTTGVFAPALDPRVPEIPVGMRPNGLACIPHDGWFSSIPSISTSR